MNSYQQLSQEERYSIGFLRRSLKSNGEIARLLNRSPSTIGRELERNRQECDGRYSAGPADDHARLRRLRSRRGFRLDAEKWAIVASLIRQRLQS